MSSSRTWFRKGIEPHTIITLDRPEPSQWEILEKLNEHDRQLEEEDIDEGLPLSYASTKLLCRDPTDHAKKAFMRIYIQVPYANTEIDDPTTRSRQATTCTPPELTAYQALTRKGSVNTPKLLGYKKGTQDSSGLVHGGFIVWLAWEMVPGLRLGDQFGGGAFWALEPREREEIRMVFLKTLP
ncbi:hypothetical protein PHISP_00632 [Aspergillus sp. HF37]|nr:hypothetical protein PHISP_00632 [Aspergillus sp. HF37]